MSPVDMKRTPSNNPDVHRDLIETTEPMSGRDVANVNRAVHARLKARSLVDDVSSPTHDEWTHAAAIAAVEACYWLGLRSETYLAKTKVDGQARFVLSQGAQSILRDPTKRDSTQLQRAKDRSAALKKGPRYWDDLAKTVGASGGKGPEAALAYLAKHLGTTERPPGSNGGPWITDIIRLAGYEGPVPWCFSPETLVNTPIGLRRIETIVPGDLVMDAHAGVAVVVAAHVRHATDRFRLAAHGIDGTTVSGEHPYIVRRRLANTSGNRRAFGDPEWVAVRDLSPGDLIAQPLLGGDMPMDEARAYLTGRWLADGWSVAKAARNGRSSRTEYFICDSHDKREELVQALDAACLGYSERIYRTVVQFSLRVDAARLLEGCGGGAKSKRLPANALMWNQNARRALMDGYLAGDGCTYRGTVSANSVSRELMLGMAQIARSLGHIVTMRSQIREPTTVIEGRTVNQATRYEMAIRPQGTLRTQVLTGVDEHVWVPVRSIDEVDPGPVHNLTVSGESTFIADGYAVHNCGCATNAGLVAAGVPNGRAWGIGYCPNVRIHAQRGTDGWSWHSEGVMGDIILFEGSDGVEEHQGLVRERLGHDHYLTREGNTSPPSGSGSQADGGGEWDRERVSVPGFRIAGFARPPWRS